jgi:LysM repeat protein
MRKFLMNSFRIITCLMLAFAIGGWDNIPYAPTYEVTAADLIYEVNAIRTANGLPALIQDPILMYTAQATAETMAAQDLHWHIGGVRERIIAAGYGNGNAWATENFSMGMSKDINDIVYVDWADPDHMIPMVNSNYVHIGAGVASANGNTWYVVHAAYPAGGGYTAGDVSSTQASGVTSTADTSNYVQPIVTSTPHEDGSVLHPILQGQVLYNIAVAYGVTVNELITLNRLSPSNPVIYQGNDLLVVPSSSPTISPVPSETPVPPTATITPSATMPPPKPTNTPSMTYTPTRKPFFPEISTFKGGSQQRLGTILIVVSVLGIGLIVFGSLRKN